MYLSRVEIDTHNRAKLKELTHLGAYHNWVEQSFPTELANHERNRHLWRVDTLGNKQFLLVLSSDMPTHEGLERYGVIGTTLIKPYDAFLARIQVDDILRFRLVANPTYAVTNSADKTQIFPHVTVAQQRQWLIKKAEKNGFQLVQNAAAPVGDGQDNFAFDITSREYQPLYRRQSRSQRAVRLSQVAYEGLLQVSNREAFLNALQTGIGREKAFGMGLMTVIPER